MNLVKNCEHYFETGESWLYSLTASLVVIWCTANAVVVLGELFK